MVVILAGSPVAFGQQAPATGDQTRTTNLTAYAELLRSDVRAEKTAIMTEVMEFTDAQASAFWPIYREYDTEMASLGDERVANVADYAAHFDAMTDDVADRLAGKALDLQARRAAAQGRLYERLKKAIGAATALRALQVEHQLQLIIDLQIAAALPISK